MKVWVKGLEYVTGGLEGQCLDAINGSLLSDGDIAIVRSAGRSYLYELDHDNSNAEASPWIIKPDKNAGTKRWILQDAASLSYWTMARAYQGTAQTGNASGAQIQVQFNTESGTGFDIGSNFASYKYTAPVSGYYQVDWSVYFTQEAASVLTNGITYLNKDGTSSANAVNYGTYGPASTYGGFVSNGSCLIYLAITNYLTVSAIGYTSSGTWQLPVAAPTFMSVYLVAKA